jgi:cytochrome bd-type quinol oxidase subunit 2
MNSTSDNTKMKRKLANRRHIIAVACILIVVSYLLMASSGGSDIFSTRRIVIAPMLCLAGYLLIIIGILKRSDEPKE